MFALLDDNQIRYCVIDGQPINAYVEPLISRDLDIVVATNQFESVEKLLAREFIVKRFAHSLNVSASDSGLRVQIQTDPRYSDFPARAETREVLGIPLRVAALQDVL